MKRICTLTQDVTNPNSDRRSKWFQNLPVWQKGTRVCVYEPNEGECGRIYGRDNTIVWYGGSANLPHQHQGDELVKHLQDVKDLGAVMDLHNAEPDDLLAVLIDHKLIRLEEVECAALILNDMEDYYQGFRACHGLR